MDFTALTSHCQLVLTHVKALGGPAVRDEAELVSLVKASAAATFALGKWIEDQV